MEIIDIRRKIDRIDSEIIKLMAVRSNLVSQAGKLKCSEQGVRDPKRVEQVIDKVRTRATDAGLSPDIAEEVYRTMVGCFIGKELKEFSDRINEPAPTAADVVIRKAGNEDRGKVTEIFNHYVAHTFAAYPDQPLDTAFFDFMKSIVLEDALYVMENTGRNVVGFGFLKKYHPYPAFKQAAETGYFIRPEYTRQGLGSRLLQTLENEAGQHGVRTLLANVSALNPQSLAFHQKHGFRECGRFKRIVRKFGQDIDIVWMQKML